MSKKPGIAEWIIGALVAYGALKGTEQIDNYQDQRAWTCRACGREASGKQCACGHMWERKNHRIKHLA